MGSLKGAEKEGELKRVGDPKRSLKGWGEQGSPNGAGGKGA